MDTPSQPQQNQDSTKPGTVIQVGSPDTGVIHDASYSAAPKKSYKKPIIIASIIGVLLLLSALVALSLR